MYEQWPSCCLCVDVLCLHSPHVHSLFLGFLVLEFLDISAQGIIVVFDDSRQSIFHCFGSYLKKRKQACSIDLSKNGSITTDNPYENSHRNKMMASDVDLLSEAYAVRSAITLPLVFSTPSEEMRERAKRKGKKRKQKRAFEIPC